MPKQKMVKVRKKYKATIGAPFNRDKVQVYGEALQDISNKNNGELKPKIVVDEARNQSNPLHEYFDWDDTSAAEKHRLFQARNMINHITVEITYDNKKEDWKGWFSVDSTPDEKTINKVYVNVERIISEPDLREQILMRAIEEADYWRQKYQKYNEFYAVCKSIERTKEKLKKTKPTKKVNKTKPKTKKPKK